MTSGDSRTAAGRARAVVIATVAAVVIVLFIGLLAIALDLGGGRSIDDALAEGDRPIAPALELPLLHPGAGLAGERDPVRLADLRGRVVVLNFWASWCRPCRTEAPILERVSRELDPARALVLGVNSSDLSGNAESFIRDHRLTFPSLRDPTLDTSEDYELTGFPETLIVDRQGRIALRHIGEITDGGELLTRVRQVSG